MPIRVKDLTNNIFDKKKLVKSTVLPSNDQSGLEEGVKDRYTFVLINWSFLYTFSIEGN